MPYSAGITNCSITGSFCVLTDNFESIQLIYPVLVALHSSYQYYICFCYFFLLYIRCQLKDLEERKNKELTDKLKEFEATTEILNKKIHDLEKAGMEKEISDLKTELDEARHEKVQMERQMQNLRGEIAKLKEQVANLQRPWWKKFFGKTDEKN